MPHKPVTKIWDFASDLSDVYNDLINCTIQDQRIEAESVGALHVPFSGQDQQVIYSSRLSM